MDHDTLNWLNLADKFAGEGDPKGMRACARELWQLNEESMDGAAVMAEAALYTGDYEEAHALLDEILHKKPAVSKRLILFCSADFHTILIFLKTLGKNHLRQMFRQNFWN